MTDRTKRLLYTSLSLLLWVLVWEISAHLLDREYFLPSVERTLSEFGALLITPNFYKITLFTLLRVILGIFIGTALGIILAVLSNRYEPVYHLVHLPVTVVRSTPIASFIIILWILLSGDALCVFVTVLMVFPIIWQNLMDGYSSIDKELCEISLVFGFSKLKHFRLITLPALKKYFIPAIITSVGLGWKAEIAAEIIAYARNSIGQMISDAKYNLLTAEVFAWTLAVVLFSILLEGLTRLTLRKFSVGGKVK
jgi:NitT/TauT family transport system permease protein